MKKLYFTIFYYWMLLVALFSCQSKTPVELPLKRITEKEQLSITNLVEDHQHIHSLLATSKNFMLEGKADSAKLVLIHATLPGGPYFKRKALIYSYLGELYHNENKDTALYYFKYSLTHWQKEEQKDGHMACVYAYIGHIHHKKNQLDSAATYLYKGLFLLNNTHKVAQYRYAYNVYYFLGSFLFDIRQPDIAQYYFTKAEDIALLNNDTWSVITARSVKAVLYAQKSQLDSAIHIYEAILQEPKANRSTKLNAYYSLGTIYALPKFKNQSEKSIPYFEKGLKLLKEEEKHKNDARPSGMSKADFLANIAAAYLNMARQQQQFSFYGKAVRTYAAIDTLDIKRRWDTKQLKDFYSNLALLYYDLGQYKKSAHLSIQAGVLGDSQHQQNTLSYINQSELQSRTAIKDKLLAQNKLQLARQQNKIQKQYIWIGGIASSALIAALLFIVLLRRKQHRTELARLKDVMAGEEKERTRIALDLHDGIVSQLSAIKINFSNLPVLHPDMNEASDDFQSALQQLEQSIAELRTTSHNMLPEILEREGLAEAVDIYCREISRMTPCAVAFLQVGVLPKLKQDFQLTIYRIIQELLQNVIKHSGATDALVQFNTDEAMLYITADDNGSGLVPGASLKLSGVGLSNLQQRMETLQGKMEIEAEDGKGTSVYLTFDLKGMIGH